MNKKKITISLLLVLTIFVIAFRFSKKETPIQDEKPKQAIKVSTKLASESNQLLQKNQYPATIVGDQEVKITSKSSGTVIAAPGNVGEKVAIGSLLAKIDDLTTLDFGDQGLKSLQVQQAEIALAQAKKSYSLAKDIYNSIRKSDSATGAQKDTAKAQVALAKLQYENAQLGLTGTVDNHLITSPITGVITNKAVSVGDSISVGQVIATVSQSSKVKIQFFVDQEKRSSLKKGQEIFASNTNGDSFSFLIRNIAVSAEPTTKRFLIEASPSRQDPAVLLSGAILNVSIETKLLTKNNNLLLPLAAINVGQNESYVFVVEDSKAKKIDISLMKVNGEYAEISSELISPESQIIVDGSKLVNDGDEVALQN